MPFKTKLDFSDNRQVKQRPETLQVLSGATSFGLPFSSLPVGPDLLTSGTTQSYFNVSSSFSGNSGTTIYSWYDSRMSLGEASLSAITPSNSATTQNSSQVYSSSSTILIDGNLVNLSYSGVNFNVIVTGMTDLGGGNYSGDVVTTTLQILSANTVDFTGRTIWADVSGITRTERLIITQNPQVGYVWTCADTEGMGNWLPSSGISADTNTFTTGATIVGTIAYFVRNDTLSAYTLNLSAFTPTPAIPDVWSGGTGNSSAVLSGSNSTALGEYTVAEGNQTLASGNTSHAEGFQTTAQGIASHAEGYQTTALGDYTHAEGNLTHAQGDYSHAEGFMSHANGVLSHAEGQGTTANGTASHSEGDLSVAQGNYSHAEGVSQANGNYSHAEGGTTFSNGLYSHAEGNSTTANGDNSHAEGLLSIATGYASHAEGGSTTTSVTASGDYSHAEGDSTTASGNTSHAEGRVTVAQGDYSHAEGNFSQAIGIVAHAEGNFTTASGDESHAEGQFTWASGNTAHAEGSSTTAQGNSSHAEGYTTHAQGGYSHAEGEGTVAFGLASHAEGDATTASGAFAHSEGSQTTAEGDYSHAEGYLTTTTTNYCHAGGHLTKASGSASFVHGSNSQANANNTIVFGLNITGATADTTYVDNLNIKTIGAGPGTSIAVDGTGHVVFTTSDIRLKENVSTLTNALDKIKSLRGVKFQLKDRIAGGDEFRLGFIAQEVNEIIPELTFINKTTPELYMGVHYDNITALLVEGIKELTSGVTTSGNVYLETQTILAEDNNIELNYSGNSTTALGGGIIVLHARGNDMSSVIITDSDGNWTTNNDFKAMALTIPTYTPTSSSDASGSEGNITRDDNYMYLKCNGVWKRSNLETF